jgi:hypothetical protein
MSLRGANDSERRSNLLVIGGIASGEEQERPRNDMGSGRLLRNKRSQRHMQQEIASGEEQERPRNDMLVRRILWNNEQKSVILSVAG